MKFNKYTISVKGIFKTKFEIYQEGKLLYKIETPGFFYKNIIFKDLEGNVVLKLRRPFTFGRFKFLFYENKIKTGELTDELMSNTYRLNSDYANYVAKGNWTSKEYTVYLGDDDIAKVSRKMFSSKDKYGIAIIEGNHDLFILAMVVIIEVVKRMKSS